ncbi:YfhO family protein [Planomicrobium sp. CPCC 101079]|uniref:YfhO family protein n=1 Tax=Planomicrobium sp. CPCC 101079 TaxID=2599618 RepID=UPI0011B744F2|nr:YfhO family protein [Planomicrobium sp. CPCC 101079]TWT16054.1 YfhO family protein [Planomicrobium sp. CPCC 101079]
MQKNYPNLLLFICCFALAILSHAVFLYQWTQNHFMIGINDGLAQMTPFKHLLYEQYTNGDFFYSYSFGLGAGIYSGLSYYFSTSTVFWLTTAFVFLLEKAGLTGTPDVLFWANAAVFISIIRLSFVLYITARVFMYMDIARRYAFIGAAFYGVSGMFFRHTAYWEFFADAFLWLPLLILGVEKIFREAKPGWFLFAVAISLINNFYFSYINFLLVGIYILVRLFIPLSPQETEKKKAIELFLLAGIFGFGISAVAFIPSVYAYLNNHRPSFSQDIAWFETPENLLYTSRYVVLPAIFVLLLFSTFLYRNKLFRLFAVLGLIAIALHHSPMAGSLFNGLSAPQHRWEYFLSLMIGGAVAVGLANFQKFTLRRFAIAAFFTVLAYLAWALADEKFDFNRQYTFFMAISLPITLLFMFLFIKFKKSAFKLALIGYLFVWMVVSANIYQSEKLIGAGELSKVNEELITGPEYDDPEIRGLLKKIEQRDAGITYRIDWMEGVRNNTPLVQNFRGLSAYSSILNKNLLFFYLYDLEIDMARESVSRYATLGNRANLFSLLQGKYVIAPKDAPTADVLPNAEGMDNVPFGFTEILESENFIVYENDYLLPFARSTSTVYQERQLEKVHPLAREHAMLEGVVLDDAENTEQLPDIEEQATEFTVENAGSTYQNGVLEIEEKIGGIDLIPDSPAAEGDFYVSFHLENRAPNEGFNLAVNDYLTSRKSNQSVYKTYVDDITVRVPAAERVQIRMPKGTYELTEIKIFTEPYDVLKSQKGQYTGLTDVDIDGNKVTVDYDNKEDDTYLTVNIPYERGWSASVNEQKTEALKANYAFIAVPLEAGKNTVLLTYRPPFFLPALIVSIFSVLIGIWFVFFKKRRTKKTER